MTDETDDDLSGLNARERAFVFEYIAKLDQTKAAIGAGYSAKTAAQKGYQLFRKVQINAAIQNRINAKWRSMHMTADETLALIAKRSRFNLKGLIKMDGGVPVVDLENATDEQLECLSEASMSETGVLKVKGPNVDASLTTMARIQGLLKDKVELSVDSDFAAKMAAAMARARPAEGDGNDG